MGAAKELGDALTRAASYLYETGGCVAVPELEDNQLRDCCVTPRR